MVIYSGGSRGWGACFPFPLPSPFWRFYEQKMSIKRLRNLSQSAEIAILEIKIFKTFGLKSMPPDSSRKLAPSALVGPPPSF